MSQKRVLVTGATGLVGSHLVSALLAKGYAVRALYRNKEQIDKCIQVAGFYGNNAVKALREVDWVKGDVVDYFSIIDALDGVSHVYHCAAMVSFDPRDKQQMILVNEEGTANMVNASLEKKVEKFCHVSSIGTLGTPVNGNLIDEETVWQSDDNHSAYSWSKFKAEMEVWRGAKEGLNAVVVNPGVILGPGDLERSSCALFGRIKKGMKYYTKGVTGFVDVRDVVNVMLLAMEGHEENERYVVVSENFSYEQLFGMMAKALKVEAPSVEASRWLTGLAWRADKMLYWFFRKKPSFTRENARISHSKSYYSSAKVLGAFNLQFIPVRQSIYDTAGWLKAR